MPRLTLLGITRGIKLPKPLLLNRPSGLYVRFFVPSDLQAQVGSRYVTRSLQGARADGARLMASALGYALANVFERLRREASKRFLPLHPELLKLGFVDYVDEVKARAEEEAFSIRRKDHQRAPDEINRIRIFRFQNPKHGLLAFNKLPPYRILQDRLKLFRSI